MPNRCRVRTFRLYSKLYNMVRHKKLRHRNLYALTRRESSATRVASASSMWHILGEQVSKLAAPIPPLRRINGHFRGNSAHTERCDLCRAFFCLSCLSFHTAEHSKPVIAGFGYPPTPC